MFRAPRGGFIRPIVYTATFAGIGASGYWLYSRRDTNGTSFDIRIRQRSPDGRSSMVTKSILQLSDSEIEERLTENEKSNRLLARME